MRASMKVTLHERRDECRIDPTAKIEADGHISPQPQSNRFLEFLEH